MDVKYGPLEQQQKQTLGEEQTRARDTTGFYDQYLRQIAQHAQNVQSIGANAAQTGLGLQQGVTGLSQASLTGIQNPANADAAARGAQAGDLSGMASNAAAIRQSLVGSFVAQQAGQNAAAQDYADTQAHVVAPGQKLAGQAMAQGVVRKARDKITETTAERGADDALFRSNRRNDEAKNVLALQIAGVNAADKAADNTLATNTLKETTRSHKADEKEAAKKRRADERKAKANQKKADADALAKGHQPNQYGVPADQWAKWSSSHRTRWIADFKKQTSTATGKDGKGKTLTPQQKYDQDFFTKYHIKPATTVQVNHAKSDIASAKVWLKRLKDQGHGTERGRGRCSRPGSRRDLDHQGKDSVAVPKLDAVLIRAAMDMGSGATSARAPPTVSTARATASPGSASAPARPGKTPISTGTGNPAGSKGTGLG
jgi:hypothetical protein